MGRQPISILIPAYNEQLNLPDCLGSVRGWAGEVFVVDSFSQDRTAEIAQAEGATVVRHAFAGYAEQKNWALDNLPFRFEWVLILDADERVSPELRDEIAEILARDGSGCDGFYVNRRFIFYGRWIRHCGWYPSWNLRLFRHRLGRYEAREVHEHLLVEGKTGYCSGDLVHEDLRDMEFWIEKHNEYSTREARELHRISRHVEGEGPSPSLGGGPLGRKRYIRERLWPHVPGRALLYFLYLFVLRLGFLDGKPGFYFCLMHGMFEQFNAVKLWELRNFKEGAPEGGVAAPSVYRTEVSAGDSSPQTSCASGSD